VLPDGTWSNTNTKVRTLPTDPQVWAVSYPYSGQPIEVVVQNQRGHRGLRSLRMLAIDIGTGPGSGVWDR
jgi:hypothetical protein